VNGHGPYRFLVDSGTNVNLFDANLARSIGLHVTFQVDLASATAKTSVPGRGGHEVLLDSFQAEDQKFLFPPMDAIRSFSSGIQGELGQWSLSGFDYTINVRAKRLEIGKQDRSGMHVPFRMINGRLAVSTRLGDLILDSGTARFVLYGVKPHSSSGERREWRTVAGSQQGDMFYVKSLTIECQTIRLGETAAISNRDETGVDGLLPLRLFKALYVCNSEGYIIFDGVFAVAVDCNGLPIDSFHR
jgi:hypothetical protein